MKKIFALALAFVLALSCAACAPKDNAPAEAPSEASSEVSSEESAEKPSKRPAGPIGGGVQIANPWLTFDTLEPAEEDAGFELTLPSPEGDFGDVIYRSMHGKVIEIIWPTTAADTVDKVIVLRKGAGSEDVSGSWVTYSEKTTADLDGITVTLEGDNGKINLATWLDGDYSYSIEFWNGNATDTETMLSLVKATK